MESAQTTGRLTLVGTPIGNLSDFSPRAVEALQACDFIAAEDTRVTLKLLNHFGISKPLVSYFDHNKRERGEVGGVRMPEGGLPPPPGCSWIPGAISGEPGGGGARPHRHGYGAGRGRSADRPFHL